MFLKLNTDLSIQGRQKYDLIGILYFMRDSDIRYGGENRKSHKSYGGPGCSESS